MRMVSSRRRTRAEWSLARPSESRRNPLRRSICPLLNCVANKARDQAWKIGDQAMKKAVYGDAFPILPGAASNEKVLVQGQVLDVPNDHVRGGVDRNVLLGAVPVSKPPHRRPVGDGT